LSEVSHLLSDIFSNKLSLMGRISEKSKEKIDLRELGTYLWF
jgi:hypothetical protein